VTAADRPQDVPQVPFVEPAPVALPVVEVVVAAKGDPVFEEQRRVAAAAVERARG
jgi:hypothetical protein